MLLLSPPIVRFESHAWDDAAFLAVDRIPKELIEDFGDSGPFAEFVDVPEQSVQVRVLRRIVADDLDHPAVGDSGTLTFYLGPAGADLRRSRVQIACTLVSIRTDLPAGKPITRTLTFLGSNPDGSDPVAITPAPVLD